MNEGRKYNECEGRRTSSCNKGFSLY